jgi:hypothetical protein
VVPTCPRFSLELNRLLLEEAVAVAGNLRRNQRVQECKVIGQAEAATQTTKVAAAVDVVARISELNVVNLYCPVELVHMARWFLLSRAFASFWGTSVVAARRQI